MKMALYRKYRSRSFSEIIGQDAVATALKNQIASGRFGHSYIFTGIRGTGKTSLAKILAKAVNCPESSGGEPCGVCDICRGIDDGSLLDVSEIDAASNSGVDNIRELRDETAFAPSVCRFRVYIIDEVHMLSKEAWGALLKIMEEPPAHVLFILATTEIHKVPATILSRCQRFDLKRIPKEKIKAHLKMIASKEDIELADSGADLIARLSDGAMRDALSLLDTCASLGGTVDEISVATLAGVADKSYLHALAEDIALKDMAKLFANLTRLYESSIDPSRLCNELLRHLRNLLVVKLAGESALSDCSASEVAICSEQHNLFTLDRLLRSLSKLTECADKLAYTPDRMLSLELCLVNLCTDQEMVAVEAKQSIAPHAIKPAKKPGEAQETEKTSDDAVCNTGNASSAGQIAEDDAPWIEKSPDIVKDSKRAVAVQIAAEPNAADVVTNTETMSKQLPEAPIKQKSPELVLSEGETLFEGWDSAVNSIRAVNPMLYGFLVGSHAYLSGSKLLIDGNEVFFKYMRENRDLSDAIADAVKTSSGIEVRIGIFDKKSHSVPMTNANAANELDDLLARAERGGIEIKMEE
ncbi:MAG: DNA polymerase III subunit gamma/tau [Oscillospiraceae bacterium]